MRQRARFSPFFFAIIFASPSFDLQHGSRDAYARQLVSGAARRAALMSARAARARARAHEMRARRGRARMRLQCAPQLERLLPKDCLAASATFHHRLFFCLFMPTRHQHLTSCALFHHH